MRAYPRYRDSGVEWLGEVPEHWDVVPLKSMLQAFVGGSWGSEAGEDEEDAHCIRATDFDYRRLLADLDSAPVRSFPQRDVLRRGLNQGELVMATSAGSTDRAVGAVVVFDGDQPALPTNFAAKMVPGDGVDTWYLAYLHNALNMMGVTRSLTNQVTIANLDTPAYLASHGPLPPLDEQRAIAAYLDRETERIDALVAKKRLLIERLEEYRTALITRTVTRGLPPEAARASGLDPSPRLRPSGVEWLGEVPEHWEVIENRRLFMERDERSTDGEGELLTVSHISGVTRRSDKPDVGMFMAETLEGYKVCHAGDLVINTMWAWMGATGVAGEKGLVSPSYNVYTPNAQLLPRFVDMAYRSARYVLGITSESRGIWTSRLRLYPQQFLSLVTAVPPMEEQHAIAAHVDGIESESSKIIETVAVAIERLEEYRTALITAAVTGKIDVRE